MFGTNEKMFWRPLQFEGKRLVLVFVKAFAPNIVRKLPEKYVNTFQRTTLEQMGIAKEQKRRKKSKHIQVDQSISEQFRTPQVGGKNTYEL